MTVFTPMDKILVEALELECIIGIYEHERVAPQRVVVDVELTVNTEPAALLDRLDLTVDYEWVTSQIAFVLKMGRFQLLEAAAHAIGRALLLPPLIGEHRGAIEAVELKLRKPGALGGRGRPTLFFARSAGDIAYRQESKAFGTVDVVFETREVGIYRLNVAPRQSIDLHIHQQMQEAELVLSDGLRCQGEPAKRGTVRVWPQGLPHRYDNPTDEVQSLLCIDRPPFMESDEIAVEGVPGRITALGPWEL